jgi:hypothetical protein
MAEGINVNDPVHERSDGWWFWDETYCQRCGPFDTEEHAKEALTYYGVRMLGGSEAEKQAVKHLSQDQLWQLQQRIRATRWEWADGTNASVLNEEEE